MIQLKGLTLQSGITYGTIHTIKPTSNEVKSFDLLINQKELLDQAIAISIEAIERLVATSESEYDDTISMIFEAHKLMVNDPLLLQKAYQQIDNGMNAYEAYKTAATEFIQQFRELTDDYIRHRIIDIEDATDRVLYTIQDMEYEMNLKFSTPKIILVREIKPSLIFGLDKNQVLGIIAETGSSDQHASMIARSKNIPSVLIPNALSIINDNEPVLLDAVRGMVYLNPTQSIINHYLSEGVELHEL